jgi:hypothetical protein
MWHTRTVGWQNAPYHDRTTGVQTRRSVVKSLMSRITPETEKSGMIAHNVYFTLNEPTPANIAELVAACHKWLPRHEGLVFYAAGDLCQDLRREVNDLEFHVGLHVVFSDMAAHDAYQISSDHKAFIEHNKAGWKKIRVFDSVVTGT